MITLKVKEYVEEPREQKIRRHFDETNSKWYFSIVDVITVLTDSTDARNYWKVLKNRLKKTDNELVTNCNQLKMRAKDGKFYLTDVADSETMIRIIESVPRASVEAFKVLVKEIEEHIASLSPISQAEEISENDAKLLVDVYQTESLVWIEAMVAGVSLPDLSITVFNKQVIIRGRREMGESTSQEKNYLHQELLWTSFSRTVLLPCPVQKDKIETTEKNGRLTIKLAKV